jgi:hypothetical protein
MRQASWLPVAAATLGALIAFGHVLCTLPVSVSSLSIGGNRNILSSRQRFTSWETYSKASKFQTHSHKEDAAAAAATAAAADYSSSLADALRQNNGSKSPPPDDATPSPFSYNGHLLFTSVTPAITDNSQAVDSEEEEDDDSYPPGSSAAGESDGSNSPTTSMRSRLADKLRKLTGAAPVVTGSTTASSSSLSSTWETSSQSTIVDNSSDLDDMNIQVKQGLYQIKSKEQHEYVSWVQGTLGVDCLSLPRKLSLSHTMPTHSLTCLPRLCLCLSIHAHPHIRT